MTEKPDEKFYDRADAHIRLANSQCDESVPGKVSASLLFAASRFNTWVSALEFESVEQMHSEKENIVEYFVSQYKSMLVDNIEDYIENFGKYMAVSEVKV